MSVWTDGSEEIRGSWAKATDNTSRRAERLKGQGDKQFPKSLIAKTTNRRLCKGQRKLEGDVSRCPGLIKSGENRAGHGQPSDTVSMVCLIDSETTDLPFGCN